MLRPIKFLIFLGFLVFSGCASAPPPVGQSRWSQGVFVKDRQFNGINQYVVVGDRESLKSQQLTISLWIKKNGAQIDRATVLNKGYGGSPPWRSYGFLFGTKGDANIYWTLGFTDNSTNSVHSSASPDNQWFLVTGSFDGNASSLYVNGALEGSNYVGKKTIKYDKAPLTIGAADGYAFFKGSIDDVRFYNRGLTASEIKSMYNEGIILKTNDTTPPTISFAYPVSGQMIYGPARFSANVSDNVGIAGVQFKVDGNNLGPEILAAPYSMLFDTSKLTLGLHTFTAVARDLAGNQTTSSQVVVTVSVPQATYVTSNEIFPNPERGFQSWTGEIKETDPIDQSVFSKARNAGNTLTRLIIRLDSYRTSPLPQSFLDKINEAFQAVRNAGIKAILRFMYNFPTDLNPLLDQNPDAPQVQIQSHLVQLAPIFKANEDIISSMEAGFLGFWGEWHHSSNGLMSADSKRAILDSILAALPPSRMVALRVPHDMEVLNGPPITSSEAYTGTNRARIGFHDDCFLAGDTDGGTWGLMLNPGDNTGSTFIVSNHSIEYDKNYVAANGFYSVVGGETCDVNPSRGGCPTALAELEKMHFSYLNEAYEPNVLAGFVSGGCFDEMKRRLGYRYELRNAFYSTKIHPGGKFHIQLTLANTGYAAMFNARPVFVVFQSGNYIYAASLSTDPRRWAAGADATIMQDISLPANMPVGTYNLYLWMPDASTSLRNNPLYAVRLANENVWSVSTGYNLLATDIEIRGESIEADAKY